MCACLPARVCLYKGLGLFVSHPRLHLFLFCFGLLLLWTRLFKPLPATHSHANQARETISVIRGKMKELNQMHNQHVNTPNFDEHAEEERKIEIATSEITNVGD